MKPQGEKPDLESTHSSPAHEQEKMESSRGWMQRQGNDGEGQRGRDPVNRSDDVYFHRYLWLQARAWHKTAGACTHTLHSEDTRTYTQTYICMHTHSYMHIHARTLTHSQASLPSPQYSHSQHKNDLTHRQEVFPRSPHLGRSVRWRHVVSQGDRRSSNWCSGLETVGTKNPEVRTERQGVGLGAWGSVSETTVTFSWKPYPEDQLGASERVSILHLKHIRGWWGLVNQGEIKPGFTVFFLGKKTFPNFR